ncbi:uncharacterized protein LOC115415555 [Sphaeramia orbicularis]|uniref:uncharacterized protein LOC115415555 n=1 Tax=Sphaeramia orbicularis TaxID=375764 RepID=UPI00117DF8EC|nr:uncharacterized protein LOC115415555 [Sphaeramia orbicularis]
MNGGGGWSRHPVSAICSGLNWIHREITCEEDYMEVNVDRESTCGGQVWRSALSKVQQKASSIYQLMFLQSDGQVNLVSIDEAEKQGYSLSSSANRVVLRSQHRGPHTELQTVDGIPVEVVRVSLVFRQKLMLLMIDLSIACTLNPGSFDGAWLLWDIPQVFTPLVGEGAVFESRSFSVGVEGVLLDESTATARGFNLVQQGDLVRIAVPFGAEGGHRKSLVVNNMYKETYMIFLQYEHVFSLHFKDSSSVDTRHRMYRAIETPLICRPVFTIDKTLSEDQMFSVYLGNVPADVVLDEVWINGKPLQALASSKRSLNPVIHVNGSRGFELRVPFEDNAVQRMYLGEGVALYSIEVNFTLTIMPQRDSYFHHTFITAHVHNAFPPEITAQCWDGGISFLIVSPLRGQSLWEVGVGLEPLTSQLAAQRGYSLHSDGHRTILDVPVLSIGYTYEDINLYHFYGTFELVLRDSKSLEVKASTSKRCPFKTQDMIVCSADGTMTAVTTLASTWPTVHPGRTRLLDTTCGPKQTDGARVLFQFKVDTCGTRSMVGESYVVYENEIISDRQLVADGPNFISRDSKFRLTMRCFYPLSTVNRLSIDRIVTSDTPGFGSVQAFEGLKDPSDKRPTAECSHGGSGQTIRNLINPVHQDPETGLRPQTKLGPIHFTTVPGDHELLSSQTSDFYPTIRAQPDPQQVSTRPDPVMSQNEDKLVFRSPIEHHLPGPPPRYNQVSNIKTPNFSSVDGLKDLASGLSASGRIPDGTGPEEVQTLQGLSSLGSNVWQSGQSNVKQSGPPNRNTQSPSQELEARLALSLYGLSVGQMEMPQGLYQPETSALYPVLPPSDHYSLDHTKTITPHMMRDKKDSPDVTEETTSKTTNSDSHGDAPESVRKDLNSNSQHKNLERTGSINSTIKTNQQGLQNRQGLSIRVKPPSKFRSLGRHHVNWNPHSLSPTQYKTGPTMAIWTSQQPSDHIGQEHDLDRSGLPTLMEDHTEPQESTGVLIQKLVRPSPQPERGQERNVQQTVSHIRVRPAPSFLGRQIPDWPRHLNQQNLDQVTAVKTSRTSKLSSNVLMPQMALGDTGSGVQSVTRSDSGELHLTSAHNGIRRGEQSS